MSLANPMTNKDSAGTSKTFSQNFVEGMKVSRIDQSLTYPEQRILTINHQRLGKVGTPTDRWERRASMSHIKKDSTTGEIYTIYLNITAGIPFSGPFALTDVRQLCFLMAYPSGVGTFSNGVFETTNWDAIMRGES